MSDSDSQYVICCPFCGRQSEDENLCVCMKIASVSDPQTIADLRAQIEQQAETTAAFERVVEMRDQTIAALHAEARAQIELRAETIREQDQRIFVLSQSVEDMAQRIQNLLAELEGRAKGTEQ